MGNENATPRNEKRTHDDEYVILDSLDDNNQEFNKSETLENVQEEKEQWQHSEDQDHWSVLVHITGGCINSKFMPEQSHETSRNPTFVVSLGPSLKTTASSTSFSGILSKPMKVFFSNLEEAQIRESTLRIEDATGSFGIEAKKFLLCSMLDKLEKQNKPAVTQTWQQVPFVWSEKVAKPSVTFPSLSQAIHSKIPLLTKKYVELSDCGWLDVEITIFHVKTGNLIFRLNTDDWSSIRRTPQMKTVKDLLETLGRDQPDVGISTNDLVTVTTPSIMEPYPFTEIEIENKTFVYGMPTKTCEKCKGEFSSFLSCGSHNCSLHFCLKCAKLQKLKQTTKSGLDLPIHEHPLFFLKCNECSKVIHSSYYFDQDGKGYCWSCVNKLSSQSLWTEKKRATEEVNISKCNLLVIKKAHSESHITPRPHLWLDKLEYVALAFQNLFLDDKRSVSEVRRIFEVMTPQVIVEAFKMWLTVSWDTPVETSVMVLGIIKERIRTNDLGNWKEVGTQCEQIVEQLLDHVPVIENKDQEYYGEIASLVQYNLDDILDIELRNFVAHKSFYHVISSGLWKRRSVNLWPFPFYVSPNAFWFVRTLLFTLFVCVLTYHAYSIPQADDLLFRNKISDVMDWSGFEAITSFDDYWSWVNNSLIPALYDNPYPHTYFLVDRIIIRQFRVEERTCSSSIYPNITSVVPTCYPRKNIASDWQEPYLVWKNVSLSSIGKSALSGYTALGFYGSESFAITLSRNRTESEQTLEKLQSEQWLDWGTQAIIIEFLIFSPNSYLVAAGVMLGEFSNVGQFVGSSDVVIVSEHYLQKEFNWSGILLLIFMIGFFIEEIADLYYASAQSSFAEREESVESYGVFSTFFLYIRSPFNLMDIFMVLSGTTYLVLQYYTAQRLQHYTLQDVWQVSEQKQIEEVFGSITIILAYFRILDYFIFWEFVGVLIIAIFSMMGDIVKFLIIFVLIVIGFSSSFHLSYSGLGTDTWDDFVPGVLTTFLTAPTGYYLPEYYNLLKTAGPIFGLICQIIFVFVVVILLLNLLVALMWQTYAAIGEQSAEEYRWHISKHLKSGFFPLWPSPLTGLHVFLMAITRPISPKRFQVLKESKEIIRSSLPINYEMVMKGMVIPFMKEDLGDDFKKYLVYDNSVFSRMEEKEKGKEKEED